MANKPTKKRLFFNDPLKAAYMAREFNVEFEAKFGFGDKEKYCKITAENFRLNKNIMSLHFVDIVNITTPFYVCKESESIFEPKKHDKVLALEKHYLPQLLEVERLCTVSTLFKDSSEVSYPGKTFNVDKVEIIMRNNKHFFAEDEVEDE